MIQKAFGDDAMSAVQIKVWDKCFKGGQEYSPGNNNRYNNINSQHFFI